MTIPIESRRWFYATVLAAILLAGFAAAIWSVKGRSLAAVETSVLGLVLIAVIALLWLEPRPIPYAVGVVCLLLAFVGLWLGSPDGGRWIANSILHDPSYGPYGGRFFGYLFLLFPVGWVLLAASVATWKIGLVTYLVAGLVFMLMNAVTGMFGPSAPGIVTNLTTGMLSPFVLGTILLLWPQYTLIFLGLFGYTFG